MWIQTMPVLLDGILQLLLGHELTLAENKKALDDGLPLDAWCCSFINLA